MNTILDIAGSVLISAAIMFIVLHLNIYSGQQKFASDKELDIQQYSKTLAEILDHDIRKVGYRYTGSNPFITTQKKVLSFYSDIDSNNVVDVVTYTVGDSTEETVTTNPRDRILARIINGDTARGPSLGLVKLDFSYFNNSGAVTAVQYSIRYIRAEIWV